MFDYNSLDAEIQVVAPGRINLIGEHIDYNGGHVLPAAIDRVIRFKFRKASGRNAEIYSAQFDRHFSLSLDHLQKSDVPWHNYLLGVLYQVNQLRPHLLEGFQCALDSTIPLGSGLSSSAALECGFAAGLNALYGLDLSPTEIITLSRDAEHTFVGTQCGIMDQFSVVQGKQNQFLLLNCETLAHQYVPVDLEPYTLVLLNSQVSHELANSAYNQRREECRTALKTIQGRYPSYQNLVEVPEAVVQEFQGEMSGVVMQRALYVTRENTRTLAAVEALQHRNLDQLGQLMLQSHAGLSQDYAVSCPELDFLVENATQLPGVLGARMMGGGFGGCTLNLLHQDSLSSFTAKMTNAYRAAYGIELEPLQVKVRDGVQIIRS